MKEKTEAFSYFSPGSMMVINNFSPHEYNGWFKKKDKKYFYVYASVVHEDSHFLQSISTTFGLFNTFMIRNSINVGRLFQSYVNKYSKKYLTKPLLNHIKSDEKLKELAGAKERSAIEYESMRRIFYAKNQKKYFFKGVSKIVPEFQSISNVSKLIPRIKIGKKYYNFGAFHLFESFASINEMIAVNRILSENEFLNYIKNLEFYPNLLMDAFMIEQLGQKYQNSYYLFRTLIDIALNPSLFDNSLHKWEDIHPGYRFIKMVNYLKNNISLINRKITLDVISELITILHQEMKWNNPWDKPELIGYDVNPFLNEVIFIRKNNPLQLILSIENREKTMKYIPFLVNDIMEDEILFDKKALVNQMMSLVAENIEDILRNRVIKCPIHHISFPPNKKCVDDCKFEMGFPLVFGISLAEFSKLPLA